jgi:hypothetical protein
MDWSGAVQRVIAHVGASSQITFSELDALIPHGNFSSRDIEELLQALQEHGIHVVEADE